MSGISDFEKTRKYSDANASRRTRKNSNDQAFLKTSFNKSSHIGQRIPNNDFNDLISSVSSSENIVRTSNNLVLENLLDDLHKTGDILKKKSTITEVRNYKNAVKAFISYVINNALTVKQSSSSRDVINRKKYMVINIVNKKLDRLAAEIVQGQLPQLILIEKIDSINGLLVNLIT